MAAEWFHLTLSAIVVSGLTIGAETTRAAALGLALVAVLLVMWWDRRRRTVVLLFDLDVEVEVVYRAFYDAFERLRACQRVWHVEARGDVRDPKYHAGASSVVKRSRVALGDKPPRIIKTNIPVPNLPAGKQTLYFFPDRLLVFSRGGVGAVPYRELAVDMDERRFIEDEAVASDTRVIGKTWRYVNKRGGPDRRFKDNRELPVAEPVNDFETPTVSIY